MPRGGVIVGLHIGPSEAETLWAGLLKRLAQRVVSDAHAPEPKAPFTRSAAAYFTGRTALNFRWPAAD